MEGEERAQRAHDHVEDPGHVVEERGDGEGCADLGGGEELVGVEVMPRVARKEDEPPGVAVVAVVVGGGGRVVVVAAALLCCFSAAAVART